MGYLYQPPFIGGDFDLPGIPLLNYRTSGLFALNEGFGVSLAGNISFYLTKNILQIGQHALPTGVLTALAGSPFATTAVSYSSVIDPTGRFLYVGEAGVIEAFNLNPVSGALTSIGLIGGGTQTKGVTVDPTGKFLYATDFVNNLVYAYTINQSTGALTLINSYATGVEPTGVAVSSNGHLAVANSAGSQISMYSINATTGALTAVAGSPFSTGVANKCNDVVFTPDGNFLYVACMPFSGNSGVYSFSVNAATGVLTQTLQKSVAVTNTVSVACDPRGRFIFAAAQNNLYVYIIDSATGRLDPVAGSPYTVGNAFKVALDPYGEVCYVACDVNGIYTFTIADNTGILTAVAGSPFSAGVASFRDIAVDPTSKYCFAPNSSATNVYGYYTSASPQLPLIEATFDQTDGTNGTLNVNGKFSVNGVSQTIPSYVAADYGKFLMINSAGSVAWDGVNTNVVIAMVANAGAFTVGDTGNYQIEVSGALTANGALTATLSIPANATQVIFDNSTTGGFPVILNATWTIPPGKSIWYWNGAVFEEVIGVYRTTDTTPLLGAGVSYVVSHLAGVVPKYVEFEVVCLVAEGNYAVGDVVQVRAEWNGAALAPISPWKNTTQCGVPFVAGYGVGLPNKTTGAYFAPTAANWAYRFVIDP